MLATTYSSIFLVTMTLVETQTRSLRTQRGMAQLPWGSESGLVSSQHC